MAPRGTPNSKAPVHRVVSKCNTTIKTKMMSNTLKRPMLTRRSLNQELVATAQATIVKKNNAVKVTLNDKVVKATQSNEDNKQPQPLTPLKENKPSTQPGSATKSAKKPTWSRRPKPAHSGVPVPEKMKRLFEKLAKEGKQL